MIKEYLEKILEKVNEPNNPSLKMSLNNVHARGLFSLVVAGNEPGHLTRIFIADKKLKPFKVQLHTHRYPITITVVKGDINHYTANETWLNPELFVISKKIKYGISDKYIKNTVTLSEFNYKSILNKGKGLEYIGDKEMGINQHKVPIGSQFSLSINDYHTMSCSKGSIWIVQEHGFQQDYSKVLGVPFTVDNLYTEPAMFQITDKTQQASRAIKKILLNYNLVN